MKYFLNMSKAFNKVWHHELIFKLKSVWVFRFLFLDGIYSMQGWTATTSYKKKKHKTIKAYWKSV